MGLQVRPKRWKSTDGRHESLYQLPNNLFLIEDGMWAASQIMQLDGLQINSEPMVRGREELLQVNGTILGTLAESIGRTNDLPHSDAAARQQERARRLTTESQSKIDEFKVTFPEKVRSLRRK